jgi:hypothetical protein
VHWWFLRHKKDKKYEKEYTLKWSKNDKLWDSIYVMW